MNALALSVLRGLPQVKVTLKGVLMGAVTDTGASQSLIAKEIAQIPDYQNLEVLLGVLHCIFKLYIF